MVYEIRESKKELEEIFKCEISGFRAPYFILPRRGYEILREAGYLYSSSKAFGLFPGRYINFSTKIKKIAGIFEFPVSRFLVFSFGLSWLRLFWPVSGFFLPKEPLVFYAHPTEFLEEPPNLGIIGKFYGRNKGEKAWEIFEEIISRYSPTASVIDYLRANFRNFGFSR